MGICTYGYPLFACRYPRECGSSRTSPSRRTTLRSVEPEFLEGVGLEDRTVEVLGLLEKQPATVLYVTGTCGVGKSTLGMRVGQVFATQLGEPFWTIDLCHGTPASPLAQQVARLLGKSAPGAREGRGVLLVDNVDEAVVGCGLLPWSTGLWSAALSEGISPPRLVILTATPRTSSSRVQSWDVSPLGVPTPPGRDLSVAVSDAGVLFLRAARRAGAPWSLDERTYPIVAALCHVAMGVPEALIELAQLSARTPLEVLAAASESQLAAFLDGAGSAYLARVRRRLAAMPDAVRELHVALSLVDGSVESEVGLALARTLAGIREGLLLWRDTVLAGLLVSASISGGLYFGMPKLIRAVAAEWLVDGDRGRQLREICGGLGVTSSSSWQGARLLSAVDDCEPGLRQAGATS